MSRADVHKERSRRVRLGKNIGDRTPLVNAHVTRWRCCHPHEVLFMASRVRDSRIMRVHGIDCDLPVERRMTVVWPV